MMLFKDNKKFVLFDIYFVGIGTAITASIHFSIFGLLHPLDSWYYLHLYNIFAFFLSILWSFVLIKKIHTKIDIKKIEYYKHSKMLSVRHNRMADTIHDVYSELKYYANHDFKFFGVTAILYALGLLASFIYDFALLNSFIMVYFYVMILADVRLVVLNTKLSDRCNKALDYLNDIEMELIDKELEKYK